MWKDNPNTEEILQRLGDFEKTTVRLNCIDRDASLHNNARIGAPIEPSNLEKLVVLISEGVTFDRVILHRESTNHMMTVVAGNHRIEACRKVGVTSVDAYVITGWDEKDVEFVALADNFTHGLAHNQSATAELAKRMVRGGASDDDIRRATGLKQGTIRHHRQSVAIADTLNDQGYRTVGWIDAHLKAARTVSHDANLLKDFVQTVNETKIDGATAIDYAKQVRECPTVDESRKLLARLRKNGRSCGKTSQGRKTLLPYEKLRNHLISARRILQTHTNLTSLGASKRAVESIGHDLSSVVGAWENVKAGK